MKFTNFIIIVAMVIATGVSILVYVLTTRQENSNAAPQVQESSNDVMKTATENRDKTTTITLVDVQLCVFSDCEKYPAGLKQLVVTSENSSIFSQGKILASADADSFEVLKIKSGTYSAFGRDKNNYYDLLSGTIINGATSENFVLDTNTTAYINGEFYNLVF